MVFYKWGKGFGTETVRETKRWKLGAGGSWGNTSQGNFGLKEYGGHWECGGQREYGAGKYGGCLNFGAGEVWGWEGEVDVGRTREVLKREGSAVRETGEMKRWRREEERKWRRR